MNMRELTVALACIVLLLIGSEAYSQTAEATAQQAQIQVGGPNISSSGAGAEANQGQEQGQSQVSQGGHGGSASNTFGINNSFNGSAPIRYLPVPTAVPMENYQPAVLGNVDYTDKGPTFISMRQLVAAMNMVDLDVEVEGDGSIRILSQMMAILPEKKKGPEDKSKKGKQPVESKPVVKFEINDGNAVNGGFKPIATLSVETKKPDKSNSASLAIAIGKKARELGAKRVIFLTEGSSKQLKSSGWGVGLSYNYATVGSKPSDSGSVGSGGTGYSQGTAGYRNLIYLTAIVGN